MHPEKLQAFILSGLDYGDTDRIMSLFTLEQGRIKVFARRARSSRKRFAGSLESCARIEAQVRMREGLCSLHQADSICLYPQIRSSLEGIALALYSCELLDSITPEGHPLPRLFRLFDAWLRHLDTGIAGESDRRFFEINLLNILGYRPSLSVCARCTTSFDTREALVTTRGELLCNHCSSGGRPIHRDSLRALAACLNTSVFGSIPFSPTLLHHAGILLDEAIAAHLDKKLKSLDFLRQTMGGSAGALIHS